MRSQLKGRRSQTALNTEASRGRDIYNMSSWHISLKIERPSDRPMKGNIFQRLTPVQRAANTTRGITPGLINPLLGIVGGRIPHPYKSAGRKMKAPKRGPPRELPSNQDIGDEDQDSPNDDFRETDDWESRPPRMGRRGQQCLDGAVKRARTNAFVSTTIQIAKD